VRPGERARPLVLIVDDDPVFRGMAREALEPAGYEMLEAPDGEQGLDLLDRRPVVVVICDLVLPGLDGVAVLARAREIRPNSLRLLVSAHGTYEWALRAINDARVHACLTKPVDFDALLTRLSGLRAERSRLVQAERLAAVGELIGGLAHELNNPLTAVTGFAELLLLDLEDRSQRSDVEKILVASRRAGRIVKNLAAFALPSRPDLEIVDLNALIKAVAGTRRAEMTDRGVELKVELDVSEPGCRGDPAGLREVFRALLDNALAAVLEREGGGGVIRIGTELRGDRVVVRVEDNGPGIAEAEMGRIFEPFYSTRNDRPGRGFGLSMAHGVVAVHGGEILADTEPGQGSRFEVVLPAIGHEAGQIALEEQDAPGRLAGITALVVDDEEQVRDFLTRVLERQQAAVRTADSGTTALALLREGLDPDVIVCDLRMPVMSGPAFFRAVQGERPELAGRFLFVTGDTVTAEAREFVAEQTQAYLGKPFTAADLVQAVQLQLEQAGTKDEPPE